MARQLTWILLFWVSAFMCKSFAQSIQSLSLPTGTYEVLNGLCRKDDIYVRTPWDCHSYVHCVPGNRHTTNLINCPAGLVFDLKAKTCTWKSQECAPIDGKQLQLHLVTHIEIVLNEQLYIIGIRFQDY